MATSGYFYDIIADLPRGHKLIEVDKGSPDKAKYAIFYAVEEDPVIFCKTKAELDKELKKLAKREDVKQKSIRVFELMKG